MTLSIEQQIAGAEGIMAGLMRRYTERVPDVEKIFSAMVDKKIVGNRNEIENDHVAFRSLGVENLGIASLDEIFLYYGFQKRDYYYFEGKKLDAYWYSPPVEHLPRIFISELRVDELSEQSQRIVRKYTDTVTSSPVQALDLNRVDQIDSYLHSSQWAIPTLSEYEELLKESEYAAWAIYNRYYLNHFTISVHSLPDEYSTLEKFNKFLESLNVVLNDSGGKIKVSPDGLLRQSSTVAEKVNGEFLGEDGGETRKMIAGSYVEFAERLPLPEFAKLPKSELRREHLRDGFEAANADKIFESTYTSQLGRE